MEFIGNRRGVTAYTLMYTGVNLAAPGGDSDSGRVCIWVSMYSMRGGGLQCVSFGFSAFWCSDFMVRFQRSTRNAFSVWDEYFLTSEFRIRTTEA